MFGKLLGAAMIVGFATGMASAAPVFDGSVTFTSGANNCAVAGASFQAIYRPQIVPADQKTGLVFFLYRSGAGFTRPTNGQFSGNGTFVGAVLTSIATVADRSGAYHLTQTPATVSQATQSVTLTGDITPTGGCRYVFKATFLRRPGT